MNSGSLSEINYKLKMGLFEGKEDIDEWTTSLVNKDDGIQFKGFVNYYKLSHYENIDKLLPFLMDEYTQITETLYSKELVSASDELIIFNVTIKENYFEFSVEGEKLFSQKTDNALLENEFYELGSLISREFYERRTQIESLLTK